MTILPRRKIATKGKMLSQKGEQGWWRKRGGQDPAPPQLECGCQATSPASCFPGYTEWRVFGY